MLNKLKATILAIVLTAALSACTTDSTLLPPESLYPSALTHCSDFDSGPPRPDKTKARTDQQRAQLAAGLYDSYMDCKTVVGGWKDRRDRYVQQYEKQHYNYVERLWRTVTGTDKSD